MPVSRKNFMRMTCLIPLLLLTAHSALAQMPIAERSLPADTVIKDSFQAGTGLPVGKIQSVRGETFVFHLDPSVGYRAKAGLPLYQGDTLQTRQNSLILCRLVDGSRLAMAAGTTLTLLESKSNAARKSSLILLSLKQGGVRFYVSGAPELSAFEFKVQTETAIILAKEADFIVKAGPERTEIIAFGKSRIEVTDLAEPEEIHFLSDFQRTVVSPESVALMIETVSPMDAEVLMAEFRLAPDSKLFPSGATNNREPDTPDESPEE